MIESVRALREQAELRLMAIADEVADLVAEEDRTRALLEALGAFIEQPQEAPDRVSPRAEPGASPPGASKPAGHAGGGVAEAARASATPSQPPAGERRTGRDGHGVPASATTPPAVLTCDHPGCDRTFDNLQRLGSHRYQAHVRQRTSAIPDAPAPRQNGHPSRSEKFLCSRCSRSFLSRSARDQHETQVECQPVPTRPPTSLKDAHEAALADVGILTGLGE